MSIDTYYRYTPEGLKVERHWLTYLYLEPRSRGMDKHYCSRAIAEFEVF